MKSKTTTSQLWGHKDCHDLKYPHVHTSPIVKIVKNCHDCKNSTNLIGPADDQIKVKFHWDLRQWMLCVLGAVSGLPKRMREEQILWFIKCGKKYCIAAFLDSCIRKQTIYQDRILRCVFLLEEKNNRSGYNVSKCVSRDAFLFLKKNNRKNPCFVCLLCFFIWGGNDPWIKGKSSDTPCVAFSLCLLFHLRKKRSSD